MASLKDICSTLVGIVSQAVYPNGISQPSIIPNGIRAFEGWPIARCLDEDLADDIVNVSVYPLTGEKNTSRYPTDWVTQNINEPTIKLTIAGKTITLTGTVSSPHNVAAIINNQSFVYAVQNGDTLNMVATGLAALVSASISGTTSNANVITLPAGALIEAARAGGSGTLIRELRRQQRDFQITVWASKPDTREIVASAIDIALAKHTFITLSDGSTARMIYKSSPQSDDHQKMHLYRRDFIYQLEFATTETMSAASIVTIQENITNQSSGASSPISTVQLNI